MADSVDSGIKHDTTSDEFLDPSCDPCKNQQQYVKVVSYCPTCVEYFCRACDRAHANFQITKRHQLKHGSDMPSCDADKPPKFQDCQIHANAVRDWFCIDHNVMICSKCRDQHDKCFIRHADDMSKILRPNDLHIFMSAVSKSKEEASVVLSDLEKNVCDIEKSRSSMLETIKIEYEKKKSKLAHMFSATCEDINKTCSEHAAILMTQIVSQSDTIEQFDSVLKCIEQEKKSRLDTKLFVKMQFLAEKTSDSIKTVHELMKGIKLIDLDFLVDETWKGLLLNDLKIGRIQEKMSQTSSVDVMPNISFSPIAEAMFQQTMFQQINFKTSRMEKTALYGSLDFGRFSSCSFASDSRLESDVFDQLSRRDLSIMNNFYRLIPTTVLIGPDKETLVAFGYEAEEKYSDLLQTGQNVDYYYYANCGKDLPTMLQSKDIKASIMRDDTGKSMSTIHVLTFVVKYLIDDLVQFLMESYRLSSLCSYDITLAVVVPSLSTDESKSIVKQAVIATGIIPPSNISIIPEAQAVSEFCRPFLESGKKEDNQRMVAYGEDYMIVKFRDAKMEVLINKYTSSFQDRVLIAQYTCAGESDIDEGFEDFLQEIVGKDVFQAFATAKPNDLRDIQKMFERKKLVMDTRSCNSINMRLGAELPQFYAEKKGQTIMKALQQSRYSRDVKISNDLWSVSSDLVRGFFNAVVMRICMLLTSVLRTRHADSIKCVFMTGDLSKMCEFQRAVIAAFPAMNLIFPQNPDHDALQGAVIHAFKRTTMKRNA